MAVSFAQDIRPLFTDMDVAHMRYLLVQLGRLRLHAQPSPR